MVFDAGGLSDKFKGIPFGARRCHSISSNAARDDYKAGTSAHPESVRVARRIGMPGGFQEA
jgi:hypothetical protein